MHQMRVEGLFDMDSSGAAGDATRRRAMCGTPVQAQQAELVERHRRDPSLSGG